MRISDWSSRRVLLRSGHDHLDPGADQRLELADTVVVGAVGAADPQRPVVEPDEIAAFEAAVAGDGAAPGKPVASQRLAVPLGRPRPSRLAPVPQVEALRAYTPGVAALAAAGAHSKQSTV